MKQLAATRLNNDSSLNATSYGSYMPNKPATWDADMIQGCEGYSYGYYTGEHKFTEYSGMNLEYQACPSTFNVRSLQNAQTTAFDIGTLTEKQSLRCLATGGTFTISFRGETSADIAYDATTVEVHEALELITTIGKVNVSTDQTSGTSSVCGSGSIWSPTMPYTMTITFLTELGEVPLLTIGSNALSGIGRIETAHTQQSSSVAKPVTCGGAGDCNEFSGECTCWPGWGSSDGFGGSGSFGDCGHFHG